MNKKVVGVVCIVSTLFALSGSASTFAVDPVDFSLTVGEVLSLSIPNQPQNISITPTAAGYYDSTSFNVTSATNSPAGYTLSMSASNTDLTSNIVNVITGEPPVIPTLTASQEGISAEAFAASTDTNVLNHYGVSIAGGNFNAMPSQTTAVKVTDENNSSSADVTSIALATKLDLNTVPGTYSTTINFTIVINSVDPVQPYPPDPCVSDPNCDHTSGTTIQRAYEIAYTTARKGMYEEDTAGSGTFHWVDSWNGVSYQGEGRDVRFLIQDMTPEICNTATVVGSTALVLDIRDQTSYRIVKAADGRCWMQDNLALDLLAQNASTRITSSNTNADSTSLKALFGIDVRNTTTDPNGNLATAGVALQGSTGSFSAPLIDASSKDLRPTVSSYDNTPDPLASLVTSENWKVGVYYNYCAATAGSYCYNNGVSHDKPNTALDTEYDICPTSWRLPTGMYYDATYYPDGGENESLENAYNSVDSLRTALRIPLAGRFDSDEESVYAQGHLTIIWSASDYGMSYMSDFTIWSDAAAADDYEYRDNGQTVRCINKTGTEPAPSNN